MHILLDADIHAQNPIFSPGDLVSGVIVWSAGTDHDHINKVRISLEGRAGQVGAHPREGYSVYATLDRQLFREEQVLERPQIRDADWRFEFRLPTTWRWFFQTPALAPSGVYHYDQGFMKLDTTSLDQPDTSALQGVFKDKRALVIIYRLSVDTVEGAVSDSDKFTARHLTVRSSVATPPATTGSVELVFKTTQWQPSPSSINKLYQRVKGHQSTGKPTYKLDALVIVPQSLWHGQHADLELKLSCSDDAPPETRLIVQEVEVKLVATTEIGSGTRRKSADSAPYEVGHLRRRPEIEIGRECTRVKLAIDLGVDSLNMPPDYLPSFRTFAPGDHAQINHHHRIDVVLVLYDDYSGHLLNLKGSRVVSVLPRIRPTNTTVNPEVEHGASGTYQASSMPSQPPSYKEAMQ